MSYMDTYKKWCTDNYFDEDTKKELLALEGNDAEIEDRFYRQLEFGTGGLRGVIGAGSFDFELSQMLPDTSASLLATLAQQNLLLDTDAFSQALYTRLWALYDGGYAGFADCGKDLSHRITQQLEHFLSFSQFADLLKSKNTTYTRICRALLHILLNIRQDDYAALWQPDGIPYLRVLGFRRNSSALLSSIKKEASVPLITKVADASSILHGIAYKRFLHDVACADLYRTTSSMQIQTELPNEYRQPIVLV